MSLGEQPLDIAGSQEEELPVRMANQPRANDALVAKIVGDIDKDR